MLFTEVSNKILVVNLDMIQPENGKKMFKIPVQEGRLVRGEILASSDGSPSQRYKLAQPGMILGSLDISVENTSGNREPWQLKETLLLKIIQQSMEP